MHYWVVVLLILFNGQISWSALLVAAPGLPEGTYNEILQERPDLKNPVTESIEDFQKLGARNEIFELSDNCLGESKCDGLTKNFEKFRSQGMITPAERKLLHEIWIKSGRRPDCYWEDAKTCIYQSVSVENLGLDKQANFVIFIDGKIYHPGDQIRVLPKRKYQWRIISPRFQTKSAWATQEEISNQVSLNTPYVTGGCLASSTVGALTSEQKRGLVVAFDKTCIRPIDESSQTKTRVEKESWLSQNKKWVLPVLGLVLGGAYYLRDKDVEFTGL